jgi:hypothetical protein
MLCKFERFKFPFFIFIALLVPFFLICVATARFGAKEAREDTLKTRMLTGLAGVPNANDVNWVEPYWYCESQTLGPCTVRVDFGVNKGGLNSSGGTRYYFWFFGTLRKVTESIWDN